MAIATAGLIVTGANAASFLRAKGSFSTFLYDLKYDPSRACSKPYRPYQMDKWAREQYVRDGETYLSCLRETANSDAEYAQQVIRDGNRKAADEFLEEVRRGY
ncbi:hypothetical protein E5675_18975 [Sphingopyxis sp. PAMC25046]|uniref:hypothetical protein n=1 Tax=Sphingopyxis sp. PAMC25046 TaxID=2565556 RepID=UPI00109E2A76|nr:hypothetical protein [Sphingopyxis sp. PAMC25046]QCB56306.1 hypothetical protein E5675_18975 [Sphingopyxis sp. PAMC25046]